MQLSVRYFSGLREISSQFQILALQPSEMIAKYSLFPSSYGGLAALTSGPLMQIITFLSFRAERMFLLSVVTCILKTKPRFLVLLEEVY